MDRRETDAEESNEEYEHPGSASIADHTSALNFLVDGDDG